MTEPVCVQAGKNWMFNNAKTAQHCELMTSHLRNRITADTAHFELRLHLIYLTNDVLHHWYVSHASAQGEGEGRSVGGQLAAAAPSSRDGLSAAAQLISAKVLLLGAAGRVCLSRLSALH